MKAHWNKRSPFNFIPQSLALLCCLALFALPVQAQNAGVDENGRAQGSVPLNAPTQPEPGAPIDDFSAGCDTDGCTKADRPVQTEGKTVVDGVGARTLMPHALQSFFVQDGAPKNSMHIAEDGSIGIGTDAPAGRLDVVDADGASSILMLDNNGNLEIGGLLTEASSVLLKENFMTVDAQDVLDRLTNLPITTWNYKTDDDAIRHMGPMAQDFYAAFGLGKDEAHIAPLDANGVAMAAAQALAQKVQVLEAQNEALLQRLEALEALVNERNK